MNHEGPSAVLGLPFAACVALTAFFILPPMSPSPLIISAVFADALLFWILMQPIVRRR